MRKTAIVLSLFMSAPAFAVKLTCAVDAVTDKRLCFPPSQLRAEGNIRRAPLYSGGPRELDPTGFTVSVNCTTKALELRDRQGVVFARNYAASALGMDLAEFLCSADLPKKKN